MMKWNTKKEIKRKCAIKVNKESEETTTTSRDTKNVIEKTEEKYTAPQNKTLRR